MDCSPAGSSVHGILQARIPEWISIPFSRGSSWPRDGTQVSCIAGRLFTIWVTREAHTGVQWPLIQYDWCRCEKRRGTEKKNTHRRNHVKTEEDQSDASTSQGAPRMTSKHRKLRERHGAEPSQALSERTRSDDTFIWDLESPELRQYVSMFQKNIYFCFIDYAKSFDCVGHNKLWEILQEKGIPYTSLTSWKICMQVKKHFPAGSDGKASAYNAGDLSSIPGSGISPGEGNDNPLQYSCLENPMDRERW